MGGVEHAPASCQQPSWNHVTRLQLSATIFQQQRGCYSNAAKESTEHFKQNLPVARRDAAELPHVVAAIDRHNERAVTAATPIPSRRQTAPARVAAHTDEDY
jgi:hypothetical protein